MRCVKYLYSEKKTHLLKAIIIRLLVEHVQATVTM